MREDPLCGVEREGLGWAGDVNGELQDDTQVDRGGLHWERGRDKNGRSVAHAAQHSGAHSHCLFNLHY